MNNDSLDALGQRLKRAVTLSGDIAEEFRALAQADDFEGRFSKSIEVLTTFIDWYFTVLTSGEKYLAPKVNEYRESCVDPLKAICEDLGRQSEMRGVIEESLIPQLEVVSKFTVSVLDHFSIIR